MQEKKHCQHELVPTSVVAAVVAAAEVTSTPAVAVKIAVFAIVVVVADIASASSFAVFDSGATIASVIIADATVTNAVAIAVVVDFAAQPLWSFFV